jgi:hypothetical protein
MCFAFRQQKAFAIVLQCNDNDKNGNDYFILSSEGDARRSLQLERTKYGPRAIVDTVSATSTCSYDFWTSTWNVSEQDSAVAQESTFFDCLS